MKKTLLALTCALACSASPVAMAAQPNGYVAIRGGTTKVDIDSVEWLPSDGSVDDSGTNVSVDVGVDFPVQEYLSLGFESGVSYLGTYKYRGPYVNINERVWSINASGVANLHITPIFSVFAKAGMGIWFADATASARAYGYSAYAEGSDSGVEPLLGVGILLGPDNVKLRAEFDSQKADTVRINSYTLGLQFGF